MAANNDFFLNFGSNAVTWGKELERDLAGARTAITGIQSMLDQLNKTAAGTGNKVQRALAGNIPTVSGSSGRAPLDGGQLLTNINHASDELTHVISGLRTVVEGLKGLPAQVGNTMRGISTSIQNEQRLRGGTGSPLIPGQAGFVPRGTAGSFAAGSFEHDISRRLTNAVKNGLSLSGGAVSASFRPTPGTPSIGTVSRAAIDQAGADRIVTAIRAQTRVIESRLRGGVNTVGAPANTVSRSGGRPVATPAATVAKAEAEVGQSLSGLYKELEAFDAELKAGLEQVATALGPNAEAAVAQFRSEMEARRAAIVANIEREESGLTRGQRSAQNRAAFAAEQANRPSISAEELARRQLAQSHVAAVNDPAFLSQIGRGQGKLSKANLREMADSLKMAGFDPKLTARMSAQEIGQALQRAGGEFRKQFTDAVPESLRTTGFNVTRATQISSELQALLGDLNAGAALAREREQQRQLVRDNIASGGDVRDPVRGRRGFGASVFDGPTPLVRSGTPQQVMEAYNLLRTSPDQEMDLARRRATSASFNPYDPALAAGIKSGNTPEEQQRAEGARLLLRGLRSSTQELDRMGLAFLKLQERLRSNKQFIERTGAALDAGQGSRAERDAIAEKQFQNRQIERTLNRLGAGGNRALFEDPAYQAGLRLREGTGSRLPRGAEGPLTARQAYQQRVEQAQQRGVTSLFGDLQRATADAVVGVRKALGSNEYIRNIPGLTVNPRTGQLGRQEGLSREDRLALNQAQTHFTAAQKQVLGGDQSAEAAAKLENAATRFANEISRLFSGQAPTVRQLTGRDPVNESNIAAEARREKARQAGLLTPSASPAATAEATAQQAKVERVVAEANGEVAKLRAERTQLQALPHTRSDIKTLEAQARAAEAAVAGRRGAALKGQVTRAQNRGDAEAAAAAQANLDARRKEAADTRAAADEARQVAARLAEIRKALSAAGGGAGAGRRPPTVSGAAGDGEDRNILARILARLDAIHGTLKGGLKVTGSAGQSTVQAARTAGTQTIPRGEVQLAQSSDVEAAKRAIAAQRSREESLGAVGSPERQAAVDAAHAKALKEVAAEEERRQKASTRSYLTQVRLDQATKLLSASTRGEVAELERLTRAGAAEERVQEQLLRSYVALDAELRRRGVGAQGRSDAARAVLGAAAPGVTGGTVQELSRTARSLNAFRTIDNTMAQEVPSGGLFSSQSKLTQKLFGNTGFWQRSLASTGTFLVRNFTAGLVFGLTNELQRAVDDAIKTQQTYVRLSATLQSTGKDVGSLRVDLQSLSSQYGVALNDLYDTAAKLAGVFDSPADLENGTRTVAMIQQISEGAIDANESVGVLTSVWAAFQDELSRQGGAEHVADVATSLQNLTGVNIEDTLEGVARLSGLAKQMGISFDETATFVAQISRETNTSGATAGEQLSRILEQAQGATGQTVLRQVLGNDIFDKNTVNGAVNYGNILKELINDWDGLSNAQQQALVHTLAGSRQAATFNALMDNGAKTLHNMAEAQNSQGAASERMAKLMKTLTGELARFRSNFQNMVNELVQTGFLDSLGIALHAVNALLSALNHMLALLNDLGESNPFVGSLIHMTATLVGAYAAVKVLVGAFQGLRGVVNGSAVAQGFFGAEAGAVAGAAGAAAGGAATGGIVAGAEGAALAAASKDRLAAIEFDTAVKGEQAATEAQLTKAERTRLTSIVAINASEEALALADQAVARATTNLVAARTAQTEIAASEGVAEAELAAAARGVLVADAELTAALEARTLAEGEAAAAAGRGGALGSIGSKLGGFLKFAGPLIALGGLLGEKDQIARVREAQGITGGDAPAQGATAEEYRVAAKNFSEAATKIHDTASGNGLFGLGFGPSLTKGLDKLIRGGDNYQRVDVNQRNQSEISRSLAQAANAMDRIDTLTQQRLEGRTVDIPKYAALDTEYLNQRIQDLTDSGHSAGDQLRNLNDALTATGKVAKVARGQFLVGGKSTDNLNDWISAVRPGVEKILSDAGIDISTGLDLQTALGTHRPVQAMQSDGSVTTSYVPTQSNVRGTSQAIGKTINRALGQAAGDLGLQDPIEATGALSDRDLMELREKGYGDAVKKYEAVRENLRKYFEADRNSYKTLIDKANLSHKDATNLIGQINQLAEGALSNLPETDLSGRTNVNRSRVQQIRAAIAKAGGRPTSQMIVDLQNAENALAESQLAELDRARVASQAADHSKAGLRAAAQRETQAAIRIAIRHGSADLLAQIIQNSGKAGQALARAAIQNMQQEINAYKRAEAQLAAVASQANAAIAEAITQGGYGAPKKPGLSQAQVNQLTQAANIPTVDTSKSPWFTGEGVPGLDAAAQDKTDANQLRQDRAALVQARLGVAEAYAQARGDAVRAAQIQVRIAGAAIAAAKADLAAAKTADERLQAQAAIAQAQAQMIEAHAAVAQAQADLVSSQYDVSIALAEAAGRTVDAARRRAAQAQAALRAALRQSHGKNTAAVNQARAAAISAEAAVRDAKLQDELDTINFNLEMGRMTQGAAISALREILKTSDLTREQRRQLMLQIKGMQDELSQSPWNFGDIKLPKPYMIRRFIEEQRAANTQAARNAVNDTQIGTAAQAATAGSVYNDHSSRTFLINGADTEKVRKIVREEVGKAGRTLTTQSRRK